MASKFDPRPPDLGMSVGRGYGANTGPAKSSPDGKVDYLQLVGQAEDISKDDFSRRVQRAIGNAQRAWRNEHSQGSKYLDKTAFRGRSRLFVPKTRSAIRKNKAGAAAALFATNDVISVSAQYDDDPMQLASAGVLSQIVNYRLDRTNHKSGMPWFPIAIAGRHAADVEGVTISKQFWDFHEEQIGTEKVLMPVIDEANGQPVINVDPTTGMPIPVLEEQEQPVMDIKRDRPMIELLPYENCYLDPAAPWYDPVQLGAWFIARYPMHLADVRQMMKQSGKNGQGIPWIDGVTDEQLRLSAMDDQRAQQRRARESGVDRLEALSMPRDWDIIWINENFIRWDGQEQCYWSAGRHALLSEPIPTEEAYPEQYGMRPYVMGVAEIEPHVLSPMPPVESWQPLQLEINDVVNLRLDATKRSIAPIAKVKRGRQVDYEQVRRRGQPEAMIILDDPETDVVFEQTPGPQGQAYTEVAHANTMMDELAGQFSSSSVQSNRQLNETVGGMKMLAGSGNATSEYDLRVWVETWVEPALRQVINLIQHYESDEKIVALAGRKAQAYQRYGVDPTLDDLLEAEVTLKVNVGIGAQDPMQMLAKLQSAMQMLEPLGEIMMMQGIQPNMEAIIEEIMGRAGFKDGHRFFHFGAPPPPQPDPEMMKVQAQIEGKKAEIQLKGQAQQQDMAMKAQAAQQDMAMKDRAQQQEMALRERQAAMDSEMQQREMQQKAAGQFMEQQLKAQGIQMEQGMKQEAAQQDMEFKRMQVERDQEGAEKDRDNAHLSEMARAFGDREAKLTKPGPDGKSRALAKSDPGASVMKALAQHVDAITQRAGSPSQGEMRLMQMAQQSSQVQAQVLQTVMQHLDNLSKQNDARSQQQAEGQAGVLAAVLKHLDQTMQQSAEKDTKLLAAIKEMVDTLSKPKRIVRDRSGSPIGVEAVSDLPGG